MVYRADPDEMRAELLRVPLWPTRRKAFHGTLLRTVFPHMTNWRPDDEAAQLRFEADTEIRRLEAA